MKTTSFFVVLFFALTQVAYAQKAKIKEAELNAQEIAKIQDILKDADASTYSASFEQDGKVTRLGSASMRGLSTVSAYHKVGSGAKASNEIVTTVGDYIKTVWTSSFASKYPEKVKAINAIMEKGASRVKPIAVRPVVKIATFTNDELVKIQDILKDADASTYSASFEQQGKVTRLGSASMRGLSTVSAYHKLGNGTKASNEIVTTVGDYIKTVWTSSFASKYPEKVKAINAIMETAARRR